MISRISLLCRERYFPSLSVMSYQRSLQQEEAYAVSVARHNNAGQPPEASLEARDLYLPSHEAAHCNAWIESQQAPVDRSPWRYDQHTRRSALNRTTSAPPVQAAYDYYSRFDNVFTGPGIVERGMIVPLPRKQTINELAESLLICPPSEMIDKLAPYAEAGRDRVILNMNFGASQAETLESIQCFAEDVMSHLCDGARMSVLMPIRDRYLSVSARKWHSNRPT